MIPDPLASRGRRVAPLLLAGLLAGAAHGAEPEALNLFRAGVAAFDAGRFDEALAAFEASLAAGQDGPAVHFNVGVAAFRIGDYERADVAFRQVAALSPEMTQLAYYNLGLVAQARGNERGARTWFRSVENMSGDVRLAGLASQQLERAASAEAPRRASGFVYAGIGHDDNVALIAETDLVEASGVADEFAEVIMSGAVRIGRSWSVDGWLTHVDYQELDEFGLSSVGGSLNRYVHRGSWRLRTALEGSHSLLDGEGFESRGSMAATADHDMGDGLALRLRYRYSHLEGLGEFPGLSGSRHEAQSTVWRRWPLGRLGFEYHVDVTDHEDKALSSRAHRLGFEAHWFPHEAWSLELQGQWRRSYFESGDPDDDRVEDRWVVAGAIGRDIGRHWRIVGRYTHLNNDSPLEVYDFSSARLVAGVEGRF